MKPILTSIAIAAGSLAVPSANIHAQTVSAVCEILFAFNAEGVELASGRYMMSEIGPQTAGMLRGDEGRAILFVLSGSLAGKSGPPHLTFYKYADRYFLRQVWDQEGKGTNIPVSAQERKLIEAQQQTKGPVEEVALVAHR